MFDPFVGVDHGQGQEMPFQVWTARPVDMVDHALGNGRIGGQFHDPGRSDLAVIATVLDGVRFAQVVQQCSGADGLDKVVGRCSLRGVAAPHDGQFGQDCRHPGHQETVPLDVLKHTVLVPPLPALVVRGDLSAPVSPDRGKGDFMHSHGGNLEADKPKEEFIDTKQAGI